MGFAPLCSVDLSLSDLNVTAVIINHQTSALTQRAIESLHRHYPGIQLLLIDNGSRDASLEVLSEWESKHPPTVVLRNPKNLYHGPAMHQAFEHCKSDFVLFLDSDCEIIRGGFIELMLDRAEKAERCYAVGRLVCMNNRGFEVKSGPTAITYIHPNCMLVRKSMYRTLPPFVHHGTPCLDNMRAAGLSGYSLVDFPTGTYVVHRGRGTAGRYGYGLGIRGRINHVLNKFGL